MEPIYGRNPQEIAEDNLLDMIETNREFAYSRQDAISRQVPIDQLNRRYNEWKLKFNELLDSCEDSPAWRERVDNVRNRWIFSLGRTSF